MLSLGLKSMITSRRFAYLHSTMAFLLFAFLSITLFPQENNPKTIKADRTSIQFSELFKTGEDLRLRGEYEEAIKQFERALFLAQKTGNEEAKLDSLLKLGILYWNIGEPKVSSDKYAQALLIAQKLQLKEKANLCLIAMEVYDYYTQAKNNRSSGDYQKSIENFKGAINLAKTIGSREHELKCLRQLSLNYWKLNNFQQFFSLNKEALLIAKELKNEQEEGRCSNNIGLFYWTIDNYSEAIKYYEKSLEIATKLKDIEEEANCLNNMGAIYIDAGNYERALDYLMQALNIDKQLRGYANISTDLNNIGSAFRRKAILSENNNDSDSARKYYNESFKYYNECLAMAIKNKDKYREIRALNNIGTIYSYLKENTKALSNFQAAFDKAKEIQDIEVMSGALNNLGIVNSQLGNYEESTKYYQRAIDLALETKEGKYLWEPYLEIANSYRNLNNFSAALDNYKKSISVIEKTRSSLNLEELKATYFGTDRRIEAYQGIIDLLIKLNQKDHDKGYGAQAFDYLERAKARSFLDSIEVSKINITEGISQQLLNQETELMNEISKLYTKLLVPQLSPEQKNSLNKELDGYEQQLESLKREIRTASPAYANLLYPKTITLSEAQGELLDEETAFFAYILAKENSYAFVVTKNDLKVFPLPERKEIQKLVREYLTAITDAQNQDFHVGYRLYRDLVRPGLGDKKIKKIIFVPDDVLYFLPFETLLAKENSREWLIKDYDIAYVPSLSSLRELIDRKKAVSQRPRKDILAVGDPSFGTHEIQTTAGSNADVFQDYSSTADYKFSRLKYSGVEIEKIASLFKPAKRDILERREASEENVKRENLSDYRIIHFATHALIDDKKPARSAIILSLDQNPKEDGFLQVREVFNLKLNADLVTLSACETGLGQLIRGEGIEGLNRAFFYAGASSVMLSLWAINDQASYQLLERFYFHLRSAQPILGALRQAKLEMIESGVLSHPYYWGSFIVTGETDKVIFPRKMNKWILVTASLCAGLALLILIINREMPSLFSSKN
jgi:CHAT domain-containing protein/Tfp pilus assembly protein PilF